MNLHYKVLPTNRSFGLVAALVSFCIMITSCSPSKKDYEERTNEIISLFYRAQYEEALRSCDDYIKRYPKSPSGYILKGHVLNRLYRANEAIDNYQKALLYTRNPKNTGIALESIGSTYLKLAQFENALLFYKRGLQEDSERSSVYMLKIAGVYLLKGEIEKAGDTYESAKKTIETTDRASQKVNPKNKGSVYGNAAFIAYQLGRNSEAFDYAVKYDNARGTDTSGLDLAIYFAELGYREKAHQKFITVIQENCDPLDLSLYYLLMNEPEKAVETFDKSYEQQKTPQQLETWKKRLNLKWPQDAWASARNQKWFKGKVD